MIQDTDMTISKVRAWAKKLHEEGKELKVLWDGGGDSGWIHFEIDGLDASGPEVDFLVEWCDNVLDYGSWAGEFSAAGEAVYDPEKECFEGIDWYSSEESCSVNNEDVITIKIPTAIKVDGLEINMETDDEEPVIQVTIKVTNGFKTDEHYEAEEDILSDIEQQYNAILKKYNTGEKKYTAAWNDEIFSKTDMTLSEDGQYWIVKWDDLSVTEWYEEDKSIVLDLKEEDDE